MVDFLKKTFAKVAERFKSLTKGQKIRLVVLLLLVAAILVTASVLLNRKSYDVLYSGMDAGEAGEVLALLGEMGVEAKAQGTSTILVESARADAVRMQLAAEGYPNSGYNFDIFEKASGLGTTDMEKRVYYQFQLQDELRRAIMSLTKVQDAVVNITLPDDSSFVLNTDKTPSTAAVILTLKQGVTLERAEARSIAEVVATSLPGLTVDNVRIIDSDMNLYDLNEDEEEQSFAQVGDQLTLQQLVKKIYKEQLLSFLTPVFGQKGVVAEVNVVLNFDKQTTQATQYSPPVEGSENGMAVSLKELAESVRGDVAEGYITGLESNGGGLSTYPEIDVTDPDNLYANVSREVNYELNEVNTLVEAAKGKIERLSASVVIDSSSMEEDYTENVRNLVATAIGVDVASVTVDMLPFVRLNASEDTAALISAQKDLFEAASRANLITSLITAGTVVVVFLLLFALIRTLKPPARRVKEIDAQNYEYAGALGEPVYANELDGENGAALEGSVSYEVGEDDELPAYDEDEVEAEKKPKKGRLGKKKSKKDAPDEALESEPVEQTEKEPEEKPPIIFPPIEEKEDTNLKQLEQYIARSPEAVALLLRNWLDER